MHNFNKRNFRDLIRTGLAFIFLSLLCVGCVSQKPLPFQFSTLQSSPASAPKLLISPVTDQRSKKDTMDKVIEIPAALDVVLVKELQNVGLFSSVTNPSSNFPKSYQIQTVLKDLRWEVPNYNRTVGTTFAISLLTGGIGGIAYGSTGIDVLGHAKMQFTLTDSKKKLLLDREYDATFTERKAKLNCDTPDTYREVAAGALKNVIEKLTVDLRELQLQ